MFDALHEIYTIIFVGACLIAAIRLRRKSSYMDMDIVNEYLFSYGNGTGYDAIWHLLNRLLGSPNAESRYAVWLVLRKFHSETHLTRISHRYGRYVNIPKNDSWTLIVDMGRAEVHIELTPDGKDVEISNPELLADMYRIQEDQFMACMAIAKFTQAVRHYGPKWLERKTFIEHIAKNIQGGIYSGFKPLNFNQDYYGMPWMIVIDNSDPNLPVEEGAMFSVEIWMGGSTFKLYSDFYNDVWSVDDQRVPFRSFRKSLLRSVKKWQETNRMLAEQPI